MNNIDILEELINGFDNLISYKQKQAISTLIAENKELKDKNKSLEQENSFLKMMYRGTDEFKAIENFIKEE